jgi:hypothetical protein
MLVIPFSRVVDPKRIIRKMEGRGGGEAQGVAGQGCQIFLGTLFQNLRKNVPNEYKMYQMVIKYPKPP